MRFPTGLLALPLALFLFTAVSAHALSQVEGTVGGSPDGSYDILIDVWDKPATADSKPRLLQTIRIAKVTVVKGRFKISVDAGLDSRKEEGITFGIRYRLFDTNKAFREGVVSSVELASL